MLDHRCLKSCVGTFLQIIVAAVVQVQHCESLCEELRDDVSDILHCRQDTLGTTKGMAYTERMNLLVTSYT